MTWLYVVLFVLLVVAALAMGIVVGADARRPNNDLLDEAEARLMQIKAREIAGIVGAVSVVIAIVLMFIPEV